MKKKFVIISGKMHTKNRNWLVLLTIIMLTALMLTAGCASKYSKYKDLYASLFEEKPSLEQNVLKDRRIVIDPGHGGYFKGALGADSLSEAEVNLGVALYLWGMLDEAGASVQLTRTSDRDFLTEDTQELKSDLNARMEKANSFDPEVFISIHHNSTLPLNRDKNRIEIFYNSKDTGASLELAQIVRLHLARNLGIGVSEIKPGSYYVLRNSAGHASILGEASYISNPAVEDKLKLSSKQKIEAESYFIALIDYFSRGVPSLKVVSPLADTLFGTDEIVYKISRGNGIPVDPASAKIYFNGQLKIPVFEKNTETLHYGISSDIPNSIHTIQASIKSVKGATATSSFKSFALSRPPKYFLPLPPQYGTKMNINLSIKIFDEYGNPVIDGAPVSISHLGSGKQYSGKCDNGIFSLFVEESLLPGSFSVDISGLSDTLHFSKLQPSEKAIVTVINVINALDEKPVPFPLIIAGDFPQAFKGNERGIVHLPDSLLNRQLIVYAGGFKPFQAQPEAVSGEKQLSTIRLTPLFKGILTGKRVAINPSLDGIDRGASSEKTVNEGSLNLKVAKKLRYLLKTSGAEVRLSRNGEEPMSVQERVAKINRFNPDLAIEINHDLKTVKGKLDYSLLYYPGSAGGIKISGLLQSALGSNYYANNKAPVESAGFFLANTSCPACEIHFNSPSENPLGEILSNPDYISLVTENIFSSILNYFDDTYLRSNPLKVKVISGGQGIPGIYVTIDNALTIPTDDNGIAAFSNIAPGKHMILIQTDKNLQNCGMRDVLSAPENEIVIELKQK